MLCSFPRIPCPDQSLGCWLEGFTAFHFLGFPKNYVTMALSELLELILGLSSFTRRNLNTKSLGLWIHLAQTLQASQPVLAWTFLMRVFSHAIIQNCTIYGITNRDLRSVSQNFFFQTIETFEYIKVRRCCHLRKFLRSRC